MTPAILVSSEQDALAIAALVGVDHHVRCKTTDELISVLRSRPYTAAAFIELMDASGAPNADRIREILALAPKSLLIAVCNARPSALLIVAAAKAGIDEVTMSGSVTAGSRLNADVDGRAAEADTDASIELLLEIAPSLPQPILANLRTIEPRRLSVTGLADSIAVTSRTLLRHCASARLSPRTIVLWFKLILGVRLIALRELPVGAAARSAGFASASHFRRHLRAVAGLRPSQLVHSPASLLALAETLQRQLSCRGNDRSIPDPRMAPADVDCA